jgi:ATP-binding cassette subfamily C protein
MRNFLFVIQSFRLLFQYNPAKLLFLFLLTLFLGFNMGFSIVLLIPFLQLLDVGEAGNSNSLVKFFNSIIENQGITLNLEVILITYAILLVLIALLLYVKAIYQAGYQQGFTYEVRQRLFRKIILSDWSVLNSKSKHNHLQVLTEEVPKLADYYHFYLKMLTSLIIVSAHLFFAFMVSVKFTILVLLAGFFSFIFLRKYLFKSYNLGSDYVDSFNRLLKYIDDFWQTLKIAKVHNSEAFYYNKFEEANTSIADLEYKLLKNYSLPQLFYKIAGVIILVVIVYAGYRIDHVPLASFFILIVLFGRIFPQFMGINRDLNQIFSNVASVKLVLALDEQFEYRLFSDTGINEMITVKNEIRIQNLHFTYPESEALFSGFSEVIPARQLTGIVGKSGQGKTTLIDLIAGLQTPDKGQILIDGTPLNEKTFSAWKHSIGYLPQDAFFIDGTIRENLVWDSHNKVSDDDIWAILKKVNAHNIVARRPQQLDTKVVNNQYYFSGGERQRLALARVLLRKPQLLLLDEATSSLDIENERKIMEVITELKSKITILFVTHRTSLLPYFDKVVKLD